MLILDLEQELVRRTMLTFHLLLTLVERLLLLNQAIQSEWSLEVILEILELELLLQELLLGSQELEYSQTA